MKNTHMIKNLLGLGSILVLAAGLTSSAFAGPSPQFLDQVERNRAANAKKSESARPADVPAMTCAACKTTAVREFHAGNAGGKVPARNEIVGSKHECAMCGGAVTVVRGVTTNDMKSNCPTCAKATPGCCGVKGQVVAIK